MHPDADRDPSTAAQRLERALAIFVGWHEAPDGRSSADLLAQHPELAELLAPMLDAGAAPEPSSRESLGGYRLLHELGRGGMGVVYEAVHAQLGRHVALKILPALPALDPSAIARFQREARLLARLAHAGIVQVLEVGQDRGQHWLAMELVSGASLAAVLVELRQRGSKDWNAHDFAAAVATCSGAAEPPAAVLRPASRAVVVARIGLQLAEALAHAHAHGIVHRDVKPSNVLARPDGSVVLSDFGVALGLDDPGLTLTGAVTGTPRYLSPEQARGERDAVDARSDLFSLGATLYELLALAPAFPGTTAADVLVRVQREDPPDLHRLDRELPRDLAAILGACLEKDPARRPADAAPLAADLRAFLDGRPVSVRRASAAERLRRWVRREPWRASAAALALFALCALTTFTAYTMARAPLVEAGAQRTQQLALYDLLARAWLWAGLDDRRARAGFDEALALAPTSADAWAGSVMASLGLDDFADAEHRITRMRELGVEPRIVDLMQARLWWGQHRREEAKELRQRVGDPQGHLELFLSGENLARIAEELPPAQVIERERQMSVAVTTLDRAILCAPEPIPSYHAVRARVAGFLSHEMAARGSSEVLRTHWPESPLAWHAIGLSLRQLNWPKDQENCVAAFRRAIELDPGFAMSWFELGALLGNRGDPEAVPLLERYLQLVPGSVAGKAQLGLALASVGRADEARALAAAIVAAVPQDRATLHGAGRVHQRLRETSRALELWQSALALAPQARDAVAHRIHVDRIALLLGQDVAAARTAAAAALAQFERADPELLLLYARALHAGGDAQAALAELDAAQAAISPRHRARKILREQIDALRAEWD